jgi:serine/threonine-protein kinase
MRAATLAVLMLCALGLAVQAQAQEGKTITVTAEGLADPNADTYKRDKGLMLEDLRADAKRQVIEKAVGSYMETSTLMQNYALVHDKVLSRSKGIIKRIVKESQPWVGEDGFAHLLVTAEV